MELNDFLKNIYIKALMTFNALTSLIFRKLITWQLVCYLPLDLIEINGQKNV